jgi:hypothetical protein
MPIRKKIDGYIGPITDRRDSCAPANGQINGTDVSLGTLTIDNSGGTLELQELQHLHSTAGGRPVQPAQVNITGQTNQNCR